MKRIALGCAFNGTDFLQKFPYKKTHITCIDSEKITKDRHRDRLVMQVFSYSLYLVVNDIIERNVTFWLPLTGGKKCNIHLKRYRGRSLQLLRQHGKWADVDILASNLSAYQLTLFMLGNRTPRTKSIYINRSFVDRITEYTNKGKQYGDGCIDTKIQDYYDEVQKKFPTLLLKDIKTILSWTWKQLYLLNSYGGDTYLDTKYIWCYIGNLRGKLLDHYHYYRRKLAVKLRIKFIRNRIGWDGYYYFALRDKQFWEYLQQLRFNCRPRKYFHFQNIMVYQILDECRVSEFDKKYIFRIRRPLVMYYKYYLKEFNDEAELYLIQPARKFKDIMVHYNKYSTLYEKRRNS